VKVYIGEHDIRDVSEATFATCPALLVATLYKWWLAIAIISIAITAINALYRRCICIYKLIHDSRRGVKTLWSRQSPCCAYLPIFTIFQTYSQYFPTYLPIVSKRAVSPHIRLSVYRHKASMRYFGAMPIQEVLALIDIDPANAGLPDASPD